MDFDIVSDNWTRFRLEDRTILRVRIDVAKIAFHGTSNIGFPNVEVAARNIVTAVVEDPSLKGVPAKEEVKLRPEDVQSGKEMKVEQMDSNWQEYKILGTPWKLLVRPIVPKVIRTQKYNQFGEPIYWASIQFVTDVKKV